MSDILEYKCPCCGGAISFNADAQKLKCPYCDSEFDVQAFLKQDERLNKQQPDTFQWDENTGREWSDDERDKISVFVCKSCAGEIVGDENTAATACPYCGNPVVMSGRLSGVLKPDFVIPFKLDKNAAKQTLKNYVGKKKFAPRSFKTENRLEEVKGLYVPFWLFDTDSDAAVSFGATKVTHWSDSNYEYTKTDYYDVYREGSMRFEHIPVDGSSKMADDLMESIEPFDFKEAVDFQTAYLAGYLADKYDVTMENSVDRANARVKSSSEQVLAATIKASYTSVTKKSSTVRTQNGKAKYVLYPVWLLNTTYKDKQYTFAMNGQTGKFVGDLPVDKGKLALLFTGLTAALSTISFLVGMLLDLI